MWGSAHAKCGFPLIMEIYYDFYHLFTTSLIFTRDDENLSLKLDGVSG